MPDIFFLLHSSPFWNALWGFYSPAIFFLLLKLFQQRVFITFPNWSEILLAFLEKLTRGHCKDTYKENIYFCSSLRTIVL